MNESPEIKPPQTFDDAAAMLRQMEHELAKLLGEDDDLSAEKVRVLLQSLK